MTTKLSGIYAIYNKITTKYYIGSSIDIPRRFKQHLRALRNNEHHSIKLQNSWNLHGEQLFEFKILLLTSENLIETEQLQIELYDSVNNGYNILPMAGTSAGRVLTEEHKKKIGAANKGKLSGRKLSEETKQKISFSNKGKSKPFTEEHKKKLSDAAKQRKPFSKETLEKLSASRVGKSHPINENAKQALIKRNKDRVVSKETREKMRLAKLGKRKIKSEVL